MDHRLFTRVEPVVGIKEKRGLMPHKKHQSVGFCHVRNYCSPKDQSQHLFGLFEGQGPLGYRIASHTKRVMHETLSSVINTNRRFSSDSSELLDTLFSERECDI